MKLKENIPTTFAISYDTSVNDGKSASDITNAKFFLALRPSDADNAFFLKSYTAGEPAAGLIYDEPSGAWLVSVSDGDLTEAALTGEIFHGVLAVKYVGDTVFREPTLTENGEPLLVYIEPKFSDD